MAVSPTLRRRRLAAALLGLRETAGSTIDEVAQQVGVSKSTLSRIENGNVTVRLPVLRQLLAHYGVTGPEAAELEELSRQAAQRGWWQLLGDAEIRSATTTLIGLEAEARRIQDFSVIVPGLLQTPDYAAAMLRGLLLNLSPAEIDRAIEIRLRRQERLAELELWVVLAEEALIRPVGGGPVMAAQIGHLLEASEAPRITIQVLGREVGAHAGLGGSFTIITFPAPADPPVVYLEGTQFDACIEDQPQVGVYQQLFDDLRASAMSRGDSRTRLAELRAGHSAA